MALDLMHLWVHSSVCKSQSNQYHGYESHPIEALASLQPLDFGASAGLIVVCCVTSAILFHENRTPPLF